MNATRSAFSCAVSFSFLTFSSSYGFGCPPLSYHSTTSSSVFCEPSCMYGAGQRHVADRRRLEGALVLLVVGDRRTGPGPALAASMPTPRLWYCSSVKLAPTWQAVHPAFSLKNSSPPRMALSLIGWSSAAFFSSMYSSYSSGSSSFSGLEIFEVGLVRVLEIVRSSRSNPTATAR